MLKLSNFQLTKVKNNVPIEILLKDVDFVDMKYEYLPAFKQTNSSGNFGVWKNGNVYLKYDKELDLQAFIGKKINELSSPYFCHTFGLCETRHYFLPVEFEKHEFYAILSSANHNRCYLCTKDVGGISHFDFFEKIGTNEKVLTSIFIQGVMALYDAFLHLNFCHGDLHFQNIIFKERNGWTKIGKENVFCEGWMPVFIDFGSSFVKIGEKIYAPEDDRNICFHNNYADVPNNVGDIFKLYYGLFEGKNLKNGQIIRDYFLEKDFDFKPILDELEKKYWITPKSREFNFSLFVEFLKENFSEYFSQDEKISFKNENEKMIMEKNAYFEEIYIYNLLIFHEEDGLDFVRQIFRASVWKFKAINQHSLEIIENVLLDYPLPFSIYTKVVEMIKFFSPVRKSLIFGK